MTKNGQKEKIKAFRKNQKMKLIEKKLRNKTEIKEKLRNKKIKQKWFKFKSD